MFDKSYFFWLISYFLPIASHLEMDIFKQLNDVISVDIISYLTWELARESEEFEMNSPRNSRESVDQQPGLRRMHLGLKAMRECLQTLEAHFSRITIHQGGDGCGSVCEDTKNVYKLLFLCKNNPLKLFIIFKIANSWCFRWGGNLEFLVFFQKSFITSTTAVPRSQHFALLLWIWHLF